MVVDLLSNDQKLVEEVKKKIEDEHNAYMDGLEKHLARAFANDLLIVSKWQEIADQAAGLLRPPKPLSPPAFSVRSILSYLVLLT